MEPSDSLLEAVAPDEPHGVIGPAVGIAAQTVDRDDTGVLQPASDLGLELEAGAVLRVVCKLGLDLLQGHITVELAVAGDEDGPEASCLVQPQDAEAVACGSPVAADRPSK